MFPLGCIEETVNNVGGGKWKRQRVSPSGYQIDISVIGPSHCPLQQLKSDINSINSSLSSPPHLLARIEVCSHISLHCSRSYQIALGF